MPRPEPQMPRRIVFINLRYKHAILTKVALITALLFVAAWFTLFSQLSFGFPVDADGDCLTSDTGNTLSQNLQQERIGDVKCQNRLAKNKQTLDECSIISPISSGYFSVQPAEVACPRSVKSRTPLCIPKLSIAEAYASLIETGATFSVEPAVLFGNLGR